MGILVISTAFFGNLLPFVALNKAKEYCLENNIDFIPIEQDLSSCSDILEFKKKYDKYFENELRINIYNT